MIIRVDAWSVAPNATTRRSFFKQVAIGVPATVVVLTPKQAQAKDSNSEAQTQTEAAKKKKALEAEARRIAAETKQRLAAGRIGTI